MELHLLGTAGYHPNSRRHTPCFMLPEIGVVLDAGTGFFRVRERLQTDYLDIFLSHAHLDHVVGLSYLFSTAWETGLKTIRVHGEAEKLQVVQDHLLTDLLFPAKLPCTFHPLAAVCEIAQGGKLTHTPLIHPGGSVGFRLDWPERSLAYITDTTANVEAHYVPFIRNVDLLIHECNFTDEQCDWAVKTGHSCVTPVAQVAREANVGRLVLVHTNPLRDVEEPFPLDAVRSIFPHISIGWDNQVIDF